MEQNDKIYKAQLRRVKNLPIVKATIVKLQTSLPRNLHYHAFRHTLDVLEEAVLYAHKDRLSQSQIDLLAVAVVFHDSGFIVSAINHEKRSAKTAVLALKKSKTYTKKQIDLVERIILDTKLKLTKSGICQVPSTKLSKYMLDADLSNFGRRDFFKKFELQRKESGISRLDLGIKVLELLRAHKWHTKPAQKLRQKQKLKNIKALIAKLRSW